MLNFFKCVYRTLFSKQRTVNIVCIRFLYLPSPLGPKLWGHRQWKLTSIWNHRLQINNLKRNKKKVFFPVLGHCCPFRTSWKIGLIRQSLGQVRCIPSRSSLPSDRPPAEYLAQNLGGWSVRTMSGGGEHFKEGCPGTEYRFPDQVSNDVELKQLIKSSVTLINRLRRLLSE